MGKGARIRLCTIAALALAATAGAIHFGGRTGDEARTVDRASAATPGAARADGEPKNESLAESLAASRPGLSREVRGDLFASLPRPQPAPAKTAPPPIESKPTAPPFPYRYGGWIAVGGARVHYLQRGNDVIAISKGEVLDGVWRIDGVREDRIEVSFVPLEQQMSMLFASLTRETAAQGGISAAAGGAPEDDAPPRRTRAPTRTPNAPAGPASVSAVPTGRLGVEAPRSGTMPTAPTQSGISTHVGPGSMPTGPAPAGKLEN